MTPNNKNKRFIKVISLFLCVLIFVPAAAQAQLGVLSSVPIYSEQIGGEAGEGGVSSGIANKLGLGGLLSAFNSAMSKLNQIQCYSQEAQKALNTAEKVDSWTFGGLKLLSGDAGEAAMIKGKITALDAAKGCVENKLNETKKTSIGTLTQGQIRQSLIQQYSTELTTIQKRLDDLNAQYRNATRSFWKTMLVKTLLTTTKAVAANLVNSLTNKYKVVDFQNYANAVGSQVYTTNLIRNNASDNGDQLILRTMLTNPIAQSQVQPAIFQRADTALGFNPDDLSWDDPNFYQKAAHVGASDTNPYVLHWDAVGRASQAQSQGLLAAQNEIALGSGLKAPRDCTGSLAQQASIDQGYRAANREYEDRAKLLADLKSYRQGMTNFTTEQAQQIDSDIAKAQQDFDSATQKLQAYPTGVSEPVVQVCKGIVSPASLVDKGINNVFQQFTSKLGDYNDNNLPFFVNFISDIGSEIGTSLIFGGNTKNVVLSEMGNIDQGAAYGLSFASQQSTEKTQQNLMKGVNFGYRTKIENGQTNYYLYWDVDKSILPDAYYIKISGGVGLPSNIYNKQVTIDFASASDKEFRVDVTTPKTYTYYLTVYAKPAKVGVEGKSLVSVSTDMTVSPPPQYTSGTGGPLTIRGGVLGASTVKPVEGIRGPVTVHLRGQ